MDDRLDVQSLARDLGSRKGQPVADAYFFLIRLGDNWSDYPFSWEPFRDIAGPLTVNPQGRPVVVQSVREPLPHPTVTNADYPVPHCEIVVAPTVPVARIVDSWVGVLRDSGLESAAHPSPWFLDQLDLTPADLSPDTVSFLVPSVAIAQETPGPSTSAPISTTVQKVGEQLTKEISASEIANAIIARHEEYAGSTVRGVVLPIAKDAPRHSWALWRATVSDLYDATSVRNSKHKVIDGRLFLVGLGLLDNAMRSGLDDVGAWAPLLLEIDEQVAPPGTQLRSHLQSVQFAHGYKSDQSSGQDQLGIQGEVNALCEVVTDPDVRPPLAVGLFGEWGSGKSFFMEKMRERVHELTHGTTQRRHQNIIQIRFNAWHYSDASLWASLAVEIFERLADPEPVEAEAREGWLHAQGDPLREQRTSLIRQLETFRTAEAALDAERHELEAKRDVLRARVQAASASRRQKIDSAPFTNVLEMVLADGNVKSSLDAIKVELGVEPAVQDLAGLSASLRSTSGYLATLWQLTKDRAYVTLAAAVVAVLVVGTAALLVADVAWFAPVVTAVVSVVATLTTALKYLKPAAERVEAGLAAVESARAAAARVQAEQEVNRAREQMALASDLAAIDREIDQAVSASVALEEQIAAKQAEVEGLAVGRQLYDFLADRADGYQKHIGVVGMLHRDFRFLDHMLRLLSKEAAEQNHAASTEPDTPAAGVRDDAHQHSPPPTGGPDARKLPAIDRVILYVDDLDRCPPAKVLEVLEAIHLLLALELFVVVVGVDPRWLQRSLRFQYRKLAAAADPRSDAYLRAMPIEYLEKIFQIPLTLARMQPSGYAQLISSLAPSLAPRTPSDAGPAAPTHRVTAGESLGGDRMPSRSLLQVQPGSSASGVGGRSIDLTTSEVAFAQGLGHLVDSPRAAKRLMNTYRLIRATQHVGSRSRFLGSDGAPGDYQALLTLLAVGAGYPTMADRVLVALESDANDLDISTWADFVKALDPAPGGQPGALVPPDISDGTDGDYASISDAAIWADLHRALESLLTSTSLPELAPYQRWGPVVARFSFTL